MDLEGIILSEVSQTEKAKTLYYNLYVKSKKKTKQMYITQQKQTHKNREQASSYHWGEERG